MKEMQLFQYVIWVKPEFDKDGNTITEAKIISDVKSILAPSKEVVERKAVKAIPEEYDSRLDDVVIVIRPF